MPGDKFRRVFSTLRYLKPVQIRYRLYYLLRNRLRRSFGFAYPLSRESDAYPLTLSRGISSFRSLKMERQKIQFTFLNLSHTFDRDQIDWNFAGYGKLWTYNLNYFEFLLQRGVRKEQGLGLIHDYIARLSSMRDGLEPFPIALRGLNWIKFITEHNIEDRRVDNALYAQYAILADNLEYHLLGNHLLENGFSLLFGAYYFRDDLLYKKARKILMSELKEQILADGAHFERSVMYHQLMLFRLLDCLNLVRNNTVFQDNELENVMIEKARKMIGWLKSMTYHDGSVPCFNDTAPGIAPDSGALFEYAKRLGLGEIPQVRLGESGYRKFVSESYEAFIDVGNIGPDYIPGHAHSDTFNFELHIHDRPFIVDTGISTYEANERRLWERSTKAHNTVEIDGLDQSEVWSSFRVADRAKIIDLKEKENWVSATHNGYKKLGLYHTRTFDFKEDAITILDKITGKNPQNHHIVAYLHFHPEVKDITLKEEQILTNSAIITVKGSKKIEIDDFIFAEGFNKTIKAKMLKIVFKNELQIFIDSFTKR